MLSFTQEENIVNYKCRSELCFSFINVRLGKAVMYYILAFYINDLWPKPHGFPSIFAVSRIVLCFIQLRLFNGGLVPLVTTYPITSVNMACYWPEIY